MKSRHLLAICLFIFCQTAFAVGDDKDTRQTLKGMGGVWVLVEPFYENAVNVGFNRYTVEADIKLQLRQNGIATLTGLQSFGEPGSPFLSVSILPRHNKKDENAAFSVSVVLRQDVRLKRDSDVSIHAATWDVSGTGYGSLQDVRDGVRDYVNEFINAYKSVNP